MRVRTLSTCTNPTLASELQPELGRAVKIKHSGGGDHGRAQAAFHISGSCTLSVPAVTSLQRASRAAAIASGESKKIGDASKSVAPQGPQFESYQVWTGIMQ